MSGFLLEEAPSEPCGRRVEPGVERLRQSREDFSFEVEDRRMLGVTARCLVTEPAGSGDAPTGVLCVSDEGALLLLRGATGELDDTLLLFTSDNGFFAGEHRVETGKNRVYEEAVRSFSSHAT